LVLVQSGESVRVSLLANFPDYVPEPRPDGPRHVRISNPFGMVGGNGGLAVVDASMNLVWDVTIRPALTEPRVVSLLTGFPFGSGAASLWRVRRHTGEVERIVGGLQTAVDVWPLTGTADLSYVLEYSQSFLTGGTGRLVRVEAVRGTLLSMADGLRTPTGLARDTRTGDRPHPPAPIRT
jgi:hypothetical protein